MRSEPVSINLLRHFDANNDHTCSTAWGNPNHTCLFLGVTGMCGQREVCRFPGAEAELERRGETGTGTLIPSSKCPFSYSE